MGSIHGVYAIVMTGRSDANIRFTDLRRLLSRLGFHERIRGDHHIFTREGVEEIINLQPLGGGKAKVRQVRRLVLQYGLVIPEQA
jgi:hypothetical protein